MSDAKLEPPTNVHIIDTASFERELFSSGHRGPMVDSHGKPRAPKTTISLPAALASLGVDARWSFHNSGNDAFSCLLAFQMLIDRDNTKVPVPSIPHKGKNAESNTLRPHSRGPGLMAIPTRNSLPIISAYGINDVGMSIPSSYRGSTGNHLTPNEFGSVQRMAGRPISFHGIGGYNRNSSVGDLSKSMQNLRTT